MLNLYDVDVRVQQECAETIGVNALKLSKFKLMSEIMYWRIYLYYNNCTIYLTVLFILKRSMAYNALG